MIECVLFDLDGTLLQAVNFHFEALNESLWEVAQYSIVDEERYNGLPTKIKLEMLVKDGIIKENQVKQIEELKQEKTIEIINNKVHFDIEKSSILAQLKANYFRVGVVTNCIHRTAELMLKRSGLLSCCDILVTNEDIIHPKPNSEPYIYAMVKLGVLPCETLIFEDSPRGLESARNTGAKVVAVQDPSELTWNLVIENLK